MLLRLCKGRRVGSFVCLFNVQFAYNCRSCICSAGCFPVGLDIVTVES
jgi:hypothetical protein